MDWLVGQLAVAQLFVRELLLEFDPRKWVDWLQLISIPIGLFWIGYQFNRLRGRGAREFDKWVQEQTTKMRKNLAEERAGYLEQVHLDAHSSFWPRTVLLIGARLKLAFLFILRLLLLRRWAPSVSYAMTLWRAGKRDKARTLLLGLAADLESKLPTYSELEDAKRLETRNAYLYAGLAAMGVEEATRSFNNVLRLSKDVDVEAHKRLARQILDGPRPVDALYHCNKLVELGTDTKDQLLLAEGYRMQAEAHGIGTRIGRELLDNSLQLEVANKNYRGIARNHELIGDIYFVRRGRGKAAAKSYRLSLQNYDWGHDWISADRVEKRLDQLLGEETFLSRLLDRAAIFIQQLATKMRAPPQTT
jgi:hypothetical protein